MIRLPARPAGGAAAVVAVFALGVWLAGDTLVASWVVQGDSMRPALQPGDRVVVDLWTLGRRPPREGEVVLFRRPEGAAVLVKRVARPPRDGRVWLLGDHGVSSDDSRAFGPVPLDRLRGRVVWRYWPPSSFGPPPAATEPRR